VVNSAADAGPIFRRIGAAGRVFGIFAAIGATHAFTKSLCRIHGRRRIAMTKLEVARAEAGGIPVLRLKGRLTLGEGSRDLRRTISDIAAEGHKSLLLDLGELSYIDSSGLGALVAGYNSLKPEGGVVGLFHVPERVLQLLEMTGLAAVFSIFATEQEATSGLPA
jgi:anti-sigma B factor antagonist